jgi:Condensation domain/Phosphopantetheine attachment site
VTSTQEPLGTVLAVWRSVLDAADIHPDDGFYQLGGTSLAAAQMVARLQAVSGRRVPMRVVLQDAITARQLARWLRDGGADGEDDPASVLGAAEPVDGSEPATLTVQQEAIWFLEQLSPDNVAYNTLSAVWLTGPLELGVLKEALAVLTRRHPLLRTTFPTRDGWPVQIVHGVEQAEPALQERSLQATSDEQVLPALRELGRFKFDVSHLPLIRWTLLRLGPQRHILAQVEHHFLHDGWSMWILLSELAASYRALVAGQDVRLPPLGLDYGQVARWQRRWLSSEGAQRQRDYWVGLLQDAPRTLLFANDHARPPYFDYSGETVEVRLPQPAVQAVQDAARRHSVTPFSVLMAAFAVTLGHVCASNTLTLGSMLRNRRLPGSNDVVGMFVNTVALPVHGWAEKTFGQLVAGLHATLVDTQEHQEFPFALVVRELELPKQLTRNPLFQVCFSMNDWPDTRLDFGRDLTARVSFPSNGGAKFDLDVVVLPDHDGYSMLWRYYAALFSRAEILQLTQAYLRLLAAAAARHDQPLGGVVAAFGSEKWW